METIQLRNVNKKIRGKPILIDINLTLEGGLVHGFYGRNASGKTMLFRAISGLVIPDSGIVDVFGEIIGDKVSFPSSMGLIIENIELWRNLTGFENLKLLAGINKKIGDSLIRETLCRVGLDPYDKRRYSAYSLGMKQKLAIAQAIMESPKLIILDEPTNGLDEESVVNFYNLLLEEKKRGATCLICSHQKEDIKLLSDATYVLDAGRCYKEEGMKK